MIDKLKDNLASVAALIAAVAAIGGGFVKYGEISTRLSQIEAAQGNVVDVSGITINAEDIAVLKEKVSKVESQKVDVSGIAKNKEAIAEVETKASVNEKTLQLFKLEIEEIKIKNKKSPNLSCSAVPKAISSIFKIDAAASVLSVQTIEERF